MFSPHILKHLAKWLVPITAFFLLLIMIVIITGKNWRLERIKLREETAVAAEKNVALTFLSARVPDAVFLADLFSTLKPRCLSKPVECQQITSLMFTFAKDKQVYDQVRLLGNTGLERVRVNVHEGNAELIRPTELQYKGVRPYFQRSLELKPGEVYISALDLNVEHGKIELPHKPMIRFTSPVFIEGKLHGVVVLNYKARLFLEKLRRATALSESTVYLVNHEGYWLLGPDPTLEWGFMFPEMEKETVGKVFPQAWKEMQSSEFGQTLNKKGLITFSRIHLMKQNKKPGAPGFTGIAEEDWIILSHVESGRLNPPWQMPFILSAVGGFLLIVATVWGITWAGARRIILEAELEESREQMQALGQASLDAMVITDDHGKITYWNPASEKMFGYTEEEAVDNEVHDLLAPPAYREMGKAGMEQFRRNGRVENLREFFEVEARRRDGSTFPMEMALYGFRTSGKTYISASIRDVTERKQNEERLKVMATTDELTGIMNRRHFLQRAESELERVRRYVRPLSCIMFDVDHFKNINDTYGHDTGDNVLKKIADVVSDKLRKVDLFGRIGGEEFILLLPETGRKNGVEVAERIRKAVEDMGMEVQGKRLEVTVSLGVTEMDSHSPRLEDMMRKADEAMYRAKKSGRNRVESEPPAE